MSKSVMLGSERELEAGKNDVVRCYLLRRQKMWRGPTQRPGESGRQRARAGESGRRQATPGDDWQNFVPCPGSLRKLARTRKDPHRPSLLEDSCFAILFPNGKWNQIEESKTLKT